MIDGILLQVPDIDQVYEDDEVEEIELPIFQEESGLTSIAEGVLRERSLGDADPCFHQSVSQLESIGSYEVHYRGIDERGTARSSRKPPKRVGFLKRIFTRLFVCGKKRI